MILYSLLNLKILIHLVSNSFRTYHIYIQLFNIINFLGTILKNRKSRKKRRLARRINGAYYDETEEMAEFILSQWQKDLFPPVLDGLFGGKPCSRTWVDKSKGFFLMSGGGS